MSELRRLAHVEALKTLFAGFWACAGWPTPPLIAPFQTMRCFCIAIHIFMAICVLVTSPSSSLALNGFFDESTPPFPPAPPLITLCVTHTLCPLCPCLAAGITRSSAPITAADFLTGSPPASAQYERGGDGSGIDNGAAAYFYGEAVIYGCNGNNCLPHRCGGGTRIFEFLSAEI